MISEPIRIQQSLHKCQSQLFKMIILEWMLSETSGSCYCSVVVCTTFVYPGCGHFDKGATRKIDDVLIEHGGLPHVLPLAVQLDFGGQVQVTILRCSYSLSIVVGPLLHA